MTPADIKALRTRLGMSQAQFGTLIGVSSRAVRYWEAGVKPPSPPAVRLMQSLTDTACYRRRQSGR